MVKYHPEAILLPNYSKPYLYCINTTKKEFELNNILYTDWDEVYGKNIEKYNNLKVKQEGYIQSSNVKMFGGIEKNISNVKIGDILFDGNIVYGITISTDLEKNKLFNLLISGKYFILNNSPVYDYNYIISTIEK
jgi:hypothetical protein